MKFFFIQIVGQISRRKETRFEMRPVLTVGQKAKIPAVSVIKNLLNILALFFPIEDQAIIFVFYCLSFIFYLALAN